MNWFAKHSVTVPSYQVRDGKVFFVVKLTPNSQSTSSFDKVSTTLRSYAQFRQLRNILLEQLNGRNSMPRRCNHQIFSTARVCRCAGNCCEFKALYRMLQSYAFPSHRLLRSRLIGLDNAAINERLGALAAFVAQLYDFFYTFASAQVCDRVQDGTCIVLKTYLNFLGASEHFFTDSSAVLHRPLALISWRQLCAEQMLAQDDEKRTNTTVVESNHDESQCHVKGKSMTWLRIENDEAQLLAPLPSLQIKTVCAHTMHSFLEEFCEQVLSRFATDIEELNAPGLTQARRWEICLYVACRIGHAYAVRLILFNHADINTVMADGSSCLHIAARMGRTDIVEILLDEGADANKANNTGVTPLIAACRNGCFEVVKLLIESGAFVSVCSKRGTYPLHAAIVSQNFKIVSMLVERGANVNAMTATGITPLHFAAKLGSLSISEYLLRHDADPEKRTKNDSDAMMIAEANGHATVCDLFQQFSGCITKNHVASNYLLPNSISDAGQSSFVPMHISHCLSYKH
ncbi:uncharacterized protein CCR75_008436 [Bremia lactucae]|uniref:PX domain-containing protein n=1 Tax=Bremia lactucae TaxID=4779 RepID=A0A976IKY5_BRELC|nr:hypothetical protein CCR75_008436 [Bremia lactucae]